MPRVYGPSHCNTTNTDPNKRTETSQDDSCCYYDYHTYNYHHVFHRDGGSGAQGPYDTETTTQNQYGNIAFHSSLICFKVALCVLLP